MSTSERLGLPYLLPNQAQKHVTVNEALRHLDALVQLTVQSATRLAEPDPPVAGEAYVLPAGATGTHWAGVAAGEIAAFQDGAWAFYTPLAGWLAWVVDENRLHVFDGQDWLALPAAGTAPPSQFGVNAQADAVNRLAVKSDAELLSHDDVTPGSGDARKVINKAAAVQTASVLFQTAFSGRAEFGLTGDDAFRLKVSGDGANWRDALVIDEATGLARFPQGVAHAETGAPQRSLIPVSGGDGVVSVYRVDAARAQSPRQFTIASIAGDTITLTTNSAAEVMNDAIMGGVALVRIWNLTRVPVEPAWVQAVPGSALLRVSDAAQLTGWQAGDAIQVGDPTDVTPNRCIALDISPMMQTLFGTEFRQAGLLMKIACGGVAGAPATLDVTPDGTSGSFLGVRSLDDGTPVATQVTLATSEPSPVSNTNLLFVREQDLGTQIGLSIVSVMGVYA